MRQPKAEELVKLKARHKALADATALAEGAQVLYMRLVGAVAEACDMPPDAMLDDRQEPWQFCRVVGRQQDGQPILEPIAMEKDDDQ